MNTSIPFLKMVRILVKGGEKMAKNRRKENFPLTPALEKFKYEVAQEIGIGKRNKNVLNKEEKNVKE